MGPKGGGGGGNKHAKHNKRKAAALRRDVKKPSNKRKGGPERDINVFKRRKYIKNNHIEPEKGEDDEEDNGESESDDEKNGTQYGKMLQVFGGAKLKNDAIDSAESEDDESDDEEDPGGDLPGNGDVIVDHPDDEPASSSEESEVVSGSDEIDSDNEEEVNHDELDEDSDEGEDLQLEDQENDVEEDVGDPFTSHVDTDLSSKTLEVLGSKQRWNSSEANFPCLGRLQIQTLATPGPITPLLPRSLASVKLKEKLAKHLKERGGLEPRQEELMGLLGDYRDVCYMDRKHSEGEQLRLAYCLHLLNHVLKTRSRILKNNSKVETAKESGGEEKLRDQGFTRPRVLILLPFKELARKVVETLISLLYPSSKGNVSNKKRFDQEYRAVPPSKGSKFKPQDFNETFEGDCDDDFKLGLGVTKSSLKLYTDFYSSDIIIASPLGLKLVIGDEVEGEDGEKKRVGDSDFLSSIELLILDQADIFLMQNWEHVTSVLDRLHLQPKDSHGVDFSRVRHWSLDGHARHYRQTLLFSGVPAPELNALWNSKCLNYKGKVRIANPVAGSGSLDRVFSDTALVWHRVVAKNMEESINERFKYFTEKIVPQFIGDNMDHTLIFVPNYLEYVKVRNWFKASDRDFCEISEYSKKNRVAKARDEFYHNEKHFMLYTERAHFYKRYRLKGIRHLVFFQPPMYPGSFADLCNLQQSVYQNPQGGSDSNMSCTVIYTRYDMLRLAQCVGSSTASSMLSAENQVHRLQPTSSY